jgi:hypothetical protein
MNRGIRAFWAAFALAHVFAACAVAADTQEQIRIVVPKFQGGSLGDNVATVLNLKIWRTLRRQPIGGKVIWTANPLPNNSYEEAERCARNAGAQMILWGDVISFGEKVLVQSFFSIPEYDDLRKEYAEDWHVIVSASDGPIDLGVSLPRRRYEFSSIILDRDLVNRYTLPSALKLYSTKGGNIQTGEVGNSFTAGQHEGDYTYVVPDVGAPGWIYLPKLSSEVEIVNFAGGLMRLFRGDYPGAIELLQKTSDTTAATSLKIDALLIQAIAKAKQNQDPIPTIDAAAELNPHLQVSVKFKVAALVWKWSTQAASPQRKREVAETLEQVISDKEYLFSPTDKWLTAAHRASDYITKKSSTN